MKINKATSFLAMGTLTLGLVGVAVLAPVANAEESKSHGTDQTLQVDVAPVLSLELTAGKGTVTGKTDGSKSAQTTGVVKSNAANGFTVTLQDKDDDNALRLGGGAKTNPGILAKAGVNEQTTEPGWSVVLGNEAKQMPTSEQDALNVASTTQPQKADYTFNVSYAIKVNNSIQSGTYSDTVVYTVAANLAPAAPAHSNPEPVAPSHNNSDPATVTPSSSTTNTANPSAQGKKPAAPTAATPETHKDNQAAGTTNPTGTPAQGTSTGTPAQGTSTGTPAQGTSTGTPAQGTSKEQTDKHAEQGKKPATTGEQSQGQGAQATPKK